MPAMLPSISRDQTSGGPRRGQGRRSLCAETPGRPCLYLRNCCQRVGRREGCEQKLSQPASEGQEIRGRPGKAWGERGAPGGRALETLLSALVPGAPDAGIRRAHCVSFLGRKVQAGSSSGGRLSRPGPPGDCGRVEPRSVLPGLSTVAVPGSTRLDVRLELQFGMEEG